VVTSCEDKTTVITGRDVTCQTGKYKVDCASRGNAETGLCVLRILCRNLPVLRGEGMENLGCALLKSDAEAAR
jgi:hypothetical protein